MDDANSQLLTSLPTTRELRECVGCGAGFIGWNWHNHCHACYRHVKPDLDAPQHDLEAEVRLLRMELEMIRLELAQERQAYLGTVDRLATLERACADLKAERDQWMDRYYQALKNRWSRRAVIPPAILRRLLWLCHPDRHGDSEAANRATAWLLSQRKQ